MSGVHSSKATSPSIVGVPWFKSEHYVAMQAILAEDEALKVTYDQWLTNVSAGNDLIASQGMRGVFVSVEPQEFTRWCGHNNRVPSSPALHEYVDAKFRERYPDEPMVRSAKESLWGRLRWHLKIAAIVLVVSGIVKVISSSRLAGDTNQNREAANTSLERAARMAAQAISKDLPKMIDSITRFDSVVAGPGAHMAFHYTITKYSSAELDPEAVRGAMQPEITQQVCSEAAFRELISRGIAVEITYSANNGIELAKFGINCALTTP